MITTLDPPEKQRLKLFVSAIALTLSWADAEENEKPVTGKVTGESENITNTEWSISDVS